MNTPTINEYLCYTCGEFYLTKNAADRCNKLPKEDLKFSVGNQVIVDACKSTEQTGTVVGIKFIAGFSGGKHFASYTIELADKSLVLRNARSLKLYTPPAHPNKQEILGGIASGREWEFRGAGEDKWISSIRGQKFPSWAPGHEYRLKPITNPHPNRAEVEAGIAAGRTWEWKFKAESEQAWSKTTQRIPRWLDTCDYRLTPEPEYVPLGPEDVPPGTVLRGAGEVDFKGWCMITSCSETGIRLWSHCDSDGREITWKSVKDDDCQINRSLPLTGKWDASAWEPCKKLKQ